MSYYIIAETIAHQFTIASDLPSLSSARNTAKTFLDVPGSIIQHCCIMDTERARCDELVTTITRSSNAEAEGDPK